MQYAPAMTVRSDTFVLRFMGQATASASGDVLASSWGEAVVQRMPDYMDDGDSPETATVDLTQAINKGFGRRFQIVSFRWLTPEDL